jgi:transcriptional regulator with GAF, ATPase, and Fis domain
MIVDIAARLATWTGRPMAELLGQSAEAALHDVLPDLPLVVETFLRSGQTVQEYPLTLIDPEGTQHAITAHLALKPGASRSQYRLVGVRLDERPAHARTVEPETLSTGTRELLGRASAFVHMLRKIELYGPTEAPVLITGETGTGKELVARALHACSTRHQQPFVAVNCAALSEELLESELFGHEKGAFTSAIRAHRGRFERAHSGTLFLDEIGDMPLRLQVKLLRALEEGVIERVGGEREIPVDVRLEAATNVPLELAVQAGTFRADLYHRLAVLRLHLPPLRQRQEDIPLLVAHFLDILNRRYHRQVRRLTPEALHLLSAYAWPGNIRELRNVLERVYVETVGDVIGRQAFDEWVEEREQFAPGSWDLAARQTARAARPVLVPPYPGMSRTFPRQLSDGTDLPPAIDMVPTTFTYLDHVPSPRTATLSMALQPAPQELTQEHLQQAYRQAAGNLTKAARLLGVHRATLYRRMQALGLTRDDLAAALMVTPTTEHDE